jgi:16S rRNA G966 N2-methylase RsmD
MSTSHIRAKFGDDYTATNHTFTLGIDTRITARLAVRFQGLNVLETCTGAGFSTIALARTAAYVTTIEINSDHLDQARQNVERAGVADKVTFVQGDSLSDRLLERVGDMDAAFLDHDWAVTTEKHVYRFRNSNTKPPADELLAKILDRTSNIALVLPPYVDESEFVGLPPHELQRVYMNDTHVLCVVLFGDLASGDSYSELRV